MKQDTARRSFNDGRFQEDRGKSLEDKRKGVGLHRPAQDAPAPVRSDRSPVDVPQEDTPARRSGYSG